MKTVVRTEKLTKRFGGLTAVDGIDLDVHEGEVFGFLGPNGAGKTTTLRLLCALIAPTSGSAEIAGFRLGRDDPKIRAAVGILAPGVAETVRGVGIPPLADLLAKCAGNGIPIYV